MTKKLSSDEVQELTEKLKNKKGKIVTVAGQNTVQVDLASGKTVVIAGRTVKPLDPAETAKAAKRFEWLLSYLICRYNFVHHVIGQMTKIPSRSVPTMGVSVTSNGKFNLYYCPEWVNVLKDSEAVYVFYHEISHLVLHHCTTRALDTTGLGNIAHDLAVNELIEEVPDICERPRDDKGNLTGVFVDELKKNPQFSDIQNKQSAEWYYEYLRNKGCTAENFGQGFDEHGGWKEHEIADERIRALVKEIETQNLWGDVSQTDREVILAAQVKRINWRNFIRTWVGNIMSKDKYATRKRPNRRTGYIHPGTRHAYQDKGLVVADTSGSTWGYDLIGMWLGVLNQLVEEVPMDFMQCDCEKTDGPWPYERRRVELEFKGKGGTSFDPIIKMVDERYYKWVMILTDGEAAPCAKPQRAQVVWVLPKGKTPPVEWGTRVHLERGV